MDVFSSFGGLTGCDFCPTEDRQANTKRDDEDGHQQSVAKLVSGEFASESEGEASLSARNLTAASSDSLFKASLAL